MIPRIPPPEVWAQGFRRELLWSLRTNWMWYAAIAAVSLLVGFWL